MSKRYYFTKHDRAALITLCTVEGALKDVIQQFVDHGRPKEWLGDLRRAQAFVVRANDQIQAYCSDENMKATVRTMNTHKIMLMPNDEADKLLKSEKHIRIPREVVENFAEAVLEAKCKGCTVADHESCLYRKSLMEAHIPPFHDPTPEGECQYKYE